jgi:hypothetical protein
VVVGFPLQLSTHFTYANPGAIVRFMAVCLRERLEKLVILRPTTYGTRREGWSLRLLGERNDCLKHLHLRYIDVRDVAVLGRCSALEQVLFEDCTLDVRDVTAFAEMPALKELSLSWLPATRFVLASPVQVAPQSESRLVSIRGQRQRRGACPDRLTDVTVS